MESIIYYDRYWGDERGGKDWHPKVDPPLDDLPRGAENDPTHRYKQGTRSI